MCGIRIHGFCQSCANAEFQYCNVCEGSRLLNAQGARSCEGCASTEFQQPKDCEGFIASTEFKNTTTLVMVFASAEFLYHGTCEVILSHVRNSSTTVFGNVEFHYSKQRTQTSNELQTNTEARNGQQVSHKHTVHEQQTIGKRTKHKHQTSIKLTDSKRRTTKYHAKVTILVTVSTSHLSK